MCQHLHLYFSSRCPLQRDSKPIFMDRTRIFPLRPLRGPHPQLYTTYSYKNGKIFALLWSSGWSCCHIDRAHIRVINVEKPVETHINAEWHIDKVFVLLLQAIIDGCQAVDDFRDGQKLTVVG